MDNFKKRLNRGERLIGTVVSLPSPEVAEVLSMAGFDWLFVDMEHGAIGIQAVGNILRAASPRTPCLARVPSIDDVWLKKCLDMGVDGVIAPQIKTAEEAETVVARCKYAPLGVRGVGVARAQGYGTALQEYVARANDEIAVVLQIEHIEAVRHIHAIVEVPGVDALFVGPYDLSASMGRIGEVDHPSVREAIAVVRECAGKAGIAMGIFTATADSAKAFMAEGYTLAAVGVDAMLLAGAATEVLTLLRPHADD